MEAEARERFPLSSALADEIRAEFPRFAIVPKAERRLHRAIDLALRVITFGRQRHYLTRYHTVLGDVLYVPSAWPSTDDVARAILFRHERMHMRQRRRHGAFAFAFLYLVPFAPIGLAWFRARFEWEAYVETLRATAELRGLEAARDPKLHEELVRRFTGPDYGWMWPFSSTIRRWIAAALDEIEREADRAVGASSPRL